MSLQRMFIILYISPCCFICTWNGYFFIGYKTDKIVNLSLISFSKII